MQLGFTVVSRREQARQARQAGEEALAPATEPMRPERRGEQRRNPSTDQKRARRRQTRKTAEMVNDADHASLDAAWRRAYDDLRNAGLEADADHPIADAYRKASDDVNHANRSRDFNIATGRPTASRIADLGDEFAFMVEGPRTASQHTAARSCDSCGGDENVTADRRLGVDLCQGCKSSLTKRRGRSVEAVNTGADGAARYQNTPDPAKPSWIVDETDTDPASGGGAADASESAYPDWEDRGDALDRITDRRKSLIEESKGLLSSQWDEGTKVTPFDSSKAAARVTAGDEVGGRLPQHGPLQERNLPAEPEWRDERNRSLQADPTDWLRWDDAVSRVGTGDAAHSADEYSRHLGEDHPIVRYLRAHAKGISMPATEAQLLAKMADAKSPFGERQAAAAQLEALRMRRSAGVRAQAETDLAASITEAHLTPTLGGQSLHSTATDWLDEVPTEGITDADEQEVRAQGSMWFGRLHEAVREDAEEFSEQARGMARRLAGSYGEDAEGIARTFLDHVHGLRRREAANFPTEPGWTGTDVMTQEDYEVPARIQNPQAPGATNEQGASAPHPNETMFEENDDNKNHEHRQYGAGEKAGSLDSLIAYVPAFARAEAAVGQQLPHNARPFVAALGAISTRRDIVGGVSAAEVVDYALRTTAGWGGAHGEQLRRALAADFAKLAEASATCATCHQPIRLYSGAGWMHEDPRTAGTPHMASPQHAAKVADFGSGPPPAPGGGTGVTDVDTRTAYAQYTLACMQAGAQPLGQAEWEAAGSPPGPDGQQQGGTPDPGAAPPPVTGVRKTADGQPPWLKDKSDGDSDDDGDSGSDPKCKRDSCGHPRSNHNTRSATGQGSPGACTRCNCPSFQAKASSASDSDSDDASSTSTTSALLGSSVTQQFRARVQAALARA